MITYDMIKRNILLFLTFTGLYPEEFEFFLPFFKKSWEDYIIENRIKGKKRKRKYGGGSKAKLDKIENKLLFILIYVKLYPLQAVIGFMFGMSQAQANVWIHILSQVLKAALAGLGELPERVPQNLEKILREEGAEEISIDATEGRCQRPKDNEKQKQYYSGKKKTHTIKNNLIINNENRKVKYLSKTCEGKKHDKKICDEEQPTYPEGITLNKDTGYQGYEPEGVITRQPKKKPRGGELTHFEKNQNSIISSTRIVVEHVISGVKRCRIVKDVYRNTKENFDDLVMEIACGLHNFRTEHRKT
ncbi:transposase family protein [Desulfobacterales bacterium HSG17]|nr:transposase family protein [Desulfobacterales bacterium HSG17]